MSAREYFLDASVSSNGAVSLFKFRRDYNIRKRWIYFVKRSYCGAFKITTNTRLCNLHFTPDSYNDCHQVKSGYLKSPLMLVSGAEPTLSTSRPSDSWCHHHHNRHYVPANDPLRPADNRCSHLCHRHYVSARECKCSCHKYCTFGKLNAFCWRCKSLKWFYTVHPVMPM